MVTRGALRKGAADAAVRHRMERGWVVADELRAAHPACPPIVADKLGQQVVNGVITMEQALAKAKEGKL